MKKQIIKLCSSCNKMENTRKHRNICRKCESKRKKEWRGRNKERERTRKKILKHKSRQASGSFNKKNLSAKFYYWGNKCWICGCNKNVTIDHVKPISKGGSNWVANLRPACSKCNTTKSNKWPDKKGIRAKIYTILRKVIRLTT